MNGGYLICTETFGNGVWIVMGATLPRIRLILPEPPWVGTEFGEAVVGRTTSTCCNRLTETAVLPPIAPSPWDSDWSGATIDENRNMPEPSPRTHLIRLGALIVCGGIAFAVFRNSMVPASWSSEDWYRKDSLAEMAGKAMKHGGNKSCLGCHEDSDNIHEDVMDTLEEGVHHSLSCESCHGPLAHHVQLRDGKRIKIAEARTEYSRLACLKCHANATNRPATHPVFIHATEKLTPWREAQLQKAAEEEGERKFYRHKKSVHPHMDCLNCHETFHDPET